MPRLAACPILLVQLCAAADTGTEILQRARQAVAEQLAHASNYTCVQTIQREYFLGQQLELGCHTDEPGTPKRKRLMRDRLRLDVAVSQGREIYAWHGEGKFTSSAAVDVVRSGPISSGNFVGFLVNIFVTPGVQFGYLGSGKSGSYRFEYSVPLACSHYSIEKADRNETAVVPYHGTFSVEGPDYRLTSLQMVTESIPDAVHVCSAKTDITYRTVNIAGYLSLIPATFSLSMYDDDALYTVSRNEYMQCREFRGASTLHFDLGNAASSSLPHTQADRQLPPGIPLRVRLRTAVDDRLSYVGDAVEGILLQFFSVPGTDMKVPEGAVLSGILTKLETHYLPDQYLVCSIKFERVSFGRSSLLMNATPVSSEVDAGLLKRMYGSPLPKNLARDLQKGEFVLKPNHIHLNKKFSAEWRTTLPPQRAD